MRQCVGIESYDVRPTVAGGILCAPENSVEWANAFYDLHAPFLSLVLYRQARVYLPHASLAAPIRGSHVDALYTCSHVIGPLNRRCRCLDEYELVTMTALSYAVHSVKACGERAHLAHACSQKLHSPLASLATLFHFSLACKSS